MNHYVFYVRHKNGWGTGCGPRPTHCSVCGEQLPVLEKGSCSTGYGCGKPEPIDTCPDMPELKPGEALERSPAVCYFCCGKRDIADMIATGKATMYLSRTDTLGIYKISNWHGSYTIENIHVRKGRHNMARVRYDAWFTGPDGKSWHGVRYGENTQILHCKRIEK